MTEFLALLEKASGVTGALPAIAALAGLVGAVFGAIGTFVGLLITRFILTPRDKQDREAEWRSHAIELTKLDLERKLAIVATDRSKRLRPSILDFLANYRDLQDLGTKSPKILYETILKDRISSGEAAHQDVKDTQDVGAEGA